MGTHSILSPSASHRWLVCTPSARLESLEPDTKSPYAEEGTLAHAWCARGLKEYLHIETYGEDAEIEHFAKYQTKEMHEHTDTYVSLVLEKLANATKITPDAQLLVETKLDLTEYVPEARGTADAIIIADKTMEVIDFKYGKGVPVSAESNTQMMIYALGAYEMFSLEYDIQDITMTIVQPRINNISEYSISAEDLMGWAKDTLIPKAKIAFEGKGKQIAGEHCKFCKIRGKCIELARTSISAYMDNQIITDSMLDIVLPMTGIIEQWCKDCKDYAFNQALKGVKIKGFKLVEGRSNRTITDKDMAIAILEKAGYATYDYMSQPSLLGITDLEKNLGKKAVGEHLGELIEKPKGKPTLVEESDKRPAINAGDDFDEINMEEVG